MSYESNQIRKSEDVPAGSTEWFGIVRLASDMIRTAISDAEDEVRSDPHSFGPASRFLMNHDTDCAENIPSSIPLWCDILGIETHLFTDWIAERLDALAATVTPADNVAIIQKSVKKPAKPQPFIHFDLFPVLLVHNAPERERVRRRRDGTGSTQLALIAA